jgi:hypothetical protein
MLKLEKFDGNKTYMFPNGAIADPATIRNHFPAVDSFTHIIEVNGDVCQAVENLAATLHSRKQRLSRRLRPSSIPLRLPSSLLRNGWRLLRSSRTSLLFRIVTSRLRRLTETPQFQSRITTRDYGLCRCLTSP